MHSFLRYSISFSLSLLQRFYSNKAIARSPEDHRLRVWLYLCRLISRKINTGFRSGLFVWTQSMIWKLASRTPVQCGQTGPPCKNVGEVADGARRWVVFSKVFFSFARLCCRKVIIYFLFINVTTIDTRYWV